MNVLIVGLTPWILDSLTKQLKADGFEVYTARNEQAAIAAIHNVPLDAISIGGAVDTATRTAIKAEVQRGKHTTTVIEVSGPNEVIPRLRALRRSKHQ